MEAPTWGDVILACTAVVAAAVAAGTAIYRMRTALNEESKRLDRQLEHDRRMREIDDLRQAIDDAVGAANAALDAIKVCRFLAQREDDELVAKKEEQTNHIGSMSREGGRLALRFGQKHSLTKLYATFFKSVLDVYDAMDSSAVPWSEGCA